MSESDPRPDAEPAIDAVCAIGEASRVASLAALEKFIGSKIPPELRQNYAHDISMIRGGWHAALEWSKKASRKWRCEVPDESGLWWWWNEDADCSPIPLNVTLSGFTGKYFVMSEQYGLNRAEDVEDMNGLWMRCVEPPLPSFEERDVLKKNKRHEQRD